MCLINWNFYARKLNCDKYLLKYLEVLAMKLSKMSFYFYRLTRTKTMGSLSHELISTTRWKTSWTNVTKPHDRSVEENRQSRSFASPASHSTCKYLAICTYSMYNNVIWSVSVNKLRTKNHETCSIQTVSRPKSIISISWLVMKEFWHIQSRI